MSVLSAQSIRRLCEDISPMIEPFTERGVVNGKSYGLSACTYDCRIDQDLVLQPIDLLPINHIPDEVLNSFIMGPLEFDVRKIPPIFRELASAIEGIKLVRGYQALASTIERFALPHNVCGSVLDKSTYARVFVSAFNTHLDPGWEGFLTVELVNLGLEPVIYKQGDPVCQIKFEWLDEPTELPYVNRKYSNQPAKPVPALSEDPAEEPYKLDKFLKETWDKYRTI